MQFIALLLAALLHCLDFVLFWIALLYCVGFNLHSALICLTFAWIVQECDLFLI